MKAPHQLLITYTLTPGQLQRITEVSSLVEVPLCTNCRRSEETFLFVANSLRRDTERTVSLDAAASLGANLDRRIGSIFIP